jgi:hypothetical protein
MACCYYGYETDPEDLNAKLKNKNVMGFVSGGNYVWKSIEKVTDKVKEALVRVGDVNPATNAQIAQIKDSIDSGYPVMLHIDYNPKDADDDQHWVLAIGYNPSDENDITIVDPIGGVVKSLKSYLGWFRPNVRRTLIDYCIFIGKVVSSNIKDIEINFLDAEGKKHTVGWYVYEWSVEKARANKAEEKFAGLNDSFTKYKESNNLIMDEFNTQVSKLTTKVTNLTDENTKLQDKIVTRDEKIAELNQQLIDQANYTVTQTIELLVSAFRKWLESVLKGGVK